jgi:uncharacterized protein (DUF39 family)
MKVPFLFFGGDSKKSYEEINEKILKGEAVVITAEEAVKMAKETSFKEVAKKIDVVTTGTFSPMCSSGAFMNFGHTTPPMRMEKIKINNVEVYGGLAAVDGYIGASEESTSDKTYGGAHVIEQLIRGDDVLLEAKSKGTDCYPRKDVKTIVNKNSINEFYLFNPRNAYQNYAAASNGSNRTIYTYMGKLLPNYGNVTYTTSGELSPLLKDPKLKTIGIGTRVFIGGTIGYVAWNGTQFNKNVRRNEYGIPVEPGATLAVIGNAKEMNANFIKAAYFKNYGVTIYIGIGIPIPVLDEDIAHDVCAGNEEIFTNLIDYGDDSRKVIKIVNYRELQSGYVDVDGKRIPTSMISSLPVARKIANELKSLIMKGQFTFVQPQPLIQHDNYKKLNVRDENVDSKKYSSCMNCGMCVGYCPVNALKIIDESLEFDPKLCTNCGICKDICPVGVKLPPL